MGKTTKSNKRILNHTQVLETLKRMYERIDRWCAMYVHKTKWVKLSYKVATYQNFVYGQAAYRSSSGEVVQFFEYEEVPFEEPTSEEVVDDNESD